MASNSPALISFAMRTTKAFGNANNGYFTIVTPYKHAYSIRYNMPTIVKTAAAEHLHTAYKGCRLLVAAVHNKSHKKRQEFDNNVATQHNNWMHTDCIAASAAKCKVQNNMHKTMCTHQHQVINHSCHTISVNPRGSHLVAPNQVICFAAPSPRRCKYLQLQLGSYKQTTCSCITCKK